MVFTNRTCTTADSAAHFGSDLSPLIHLQIVDVIFDSEHYLFKIDSNIRTIVAGSGVLDVSAMFKEPVKDIHLYNWSAVEDILFLGTLQLKFLLDPHKGNSTFTVIKWWCVS